MVSKPHVMNLIHLALEGWFWSLAWDFHSVFLFFFSKHVSWLHLTPFLSVRLMWVQDSYNRITSFQALGVFARCVVQAPWWIHHITDVPQMDTWTGKPSQLAHNLASRVVIKKGDPLSEHVVKLIKHSTNTSVNIATKVTLYLAENKNSFNLVQLRWS